MLNPLSSARPTARRIYRQIVTLVSLIVWLGATTGCYHWRPLPTQSAPEALQPSDRVRVGVATSTTPAERPRCPEDNPCCQGCREVKLKLSSVTSQYLLGSRLDGGGELRLDRALVRSMERREVEWLGTGAWIGTGVLIVAGIVAASIAASMWDPSFGSY